MSEREGEMDRYLVSKKREMDSGTETEKEGERERKDESFNKISNPLPIEFRPYLDAGFDSSGHRVSASSLRAGHSFSFVSIIHFFFFFHFLFLCVPLN